MLTTALASLARERRRFAQSTLLGAGSDGIGDRQQKTAALSERRPGPTAPAGAGRGGRHHQRRQVERELRPVTRSCGPLRWDTTDVGQVA